VNADEILHVLRLVAMGRVNHPEQVRFAELLAERLADKPLPVVDVPAPVEIALVSEGEPAAAEAKRRGRPPKKAD
jgi:hypothetical protein